jgi:hypothetical protein
LLLGQCGDFSHPYVTHQKSEVLMVFLYLFSLPHWLYYKLWNLVCLIHLLFSWPSALLFQSWGCSYLFLSCL